MYYSVETTQGAYEANTLKEVAGQIVYCLVETSEIGNRADEVTIESIIQMSDDGDEINIASEQECRAFDKLCNDRIEFEHGEREGGESWTDFVRSEFVSNVQEA